MEPFIGQIQSFAFSYAPQGWAQCNGQQLPISENQALFAVIGTTYGGNGVTTFALPDLRGRVLMHLGTGNGLSTHMIGEFSGYEQVPLTEAQMPSHNHMVNCVDSNGNVSAPSNAFPGAEAAPTVDIWSSDAPTAQMAQEMIAASGNGQPHNNMQPYLVVNWCIATDGLFPPRP